MWLRRKNLKAAGTTKKNRKKKKKSKNRNSRNKKRNDFERDKDGDSFIMITIPDDVAGEEIENEETTRRDDDDRQYYIDHRCKLLSNTTYVSPSPSEEILAAAEIEDEEDEARDDDYDEARDDDTDVVVAVSAPFCSTTNYFVGTGGGGGGIGCSNRRDNKEVEEVLPAPCTRLDAAVNDDDDGVINNGDDDASIAAVAADNKPKQEEEQQDYYELLGVKTRYKATQDEIKRAYKHKCMLLHPDKLIQRNNPRNRNRKYIPSERDYAKFAQIQEAYQCLIDRDSKEMYDSLLRLEKQFDYDDHEDKKKQKEAVVASAVDDDDDGSSIAIDYSAEQQKLVVNGSTTTDSPSIYTKTRLLPQPSSTTGDYINKNNTKTRLLLQPTTAEDEMSTIVQNNRSNNCMMYKNKIHQRISSLAADDSVTTTSSRLDYLAQAAAATSSVAGTTTTTTTRRDKKMHGEVSERITEAREQQEQQPQKKNTVISDCFNSLITNYIIPASGTTTEADGIEPTTARATIETAPAPTPAAETSSVAVEGTTTTSDYNRNNNNRYNYDCMMYNNCKSATSSITELHQMSSFVTSIASSSQADSTAAATTSGKKMDDDADDDYEVSAIEQIILEEREQQQQQQQQQPTSTTTVVCNYINSLISNDIIIPSGTTIKADRIETTTASAPVPASSTTTHVSTGQQSQEIQQKQQQQQQQVPDDTTQEAIEAIIASSAAESGEALAPALVAVTAYYSGKNSSETMKTRNNSGGDDDEVNDEVDVVEAALAKHSCKEQEQQQQQQQQKDDDEAATTTTTTSSTIQSQPSSSAVEDYYNSITTYISNTTKAIVATTPTPVTEFQVYQDPDTQEIINILTEKLWEDLKNNIKSVQNTLKRLCDLLEQKSISNKESRAMKCRNNNMAAYHNGAILALCQQMKRFANDEAIQRICICLFISMAYYCYVDPNANTSRAGTSATADVVSNNNSNICQDMINQGALKLCLVTMKRFNKGNNNRYASLLPSACCRLLGNMMENKVLVKQVIDAGGLTAILLAMMDHPHNVWIQEEGCFAVRRLLDNSSSDSTLYYGAGNAEKIIEVIIDTMANHEDNKRILIRACYILHHLAKNNDTHRKMIIDSKGLVGVSNAISIHHDDSDVKDAASKALKVLWPGATDSALAIITTSAGGSDRSISTTNSRGGAGIGRFISLGRQKTKQVEDAAGCNVLRIYDGELQAEGPERWWRQTAASF